MSFEEARRLFETGISRGMISEPDKNGIPKYVWALDGNGEVYEAKTAPGQNEPYHGYLLGDDDRKMKEYIKSEWKGREA